MTSVHCPGSPHPAHITSSQSSPSLSPSVTPSTFHSRLKTHLFHKSFPQRRTGVCLFQFLFLLLLMIIGLQHNCIQTVAATYTR